MSGVKAIIRDDNGNCIVKCPKCEYYQYGNFVPLNCPQCRVHFTNSDVSIAAISEAEDAWEDRVSSYGRWY